MEPERTHHQQIYTIEMRTAVLQAKGKLQMEFQRLNGRMNEKKKRKKNLKYARNDKYMGKNKT